MTDADLAAFRNFISTSGLAGQWQRLPARIDSPEIKRAYPNHRFYFTFERSPTPPGAPLPDLLAQHDEAVRNWQRNSLRLTVAIDASGKVRALKSPQDFNAGLMAVTNDAEAAVAGAAIASLLNEHDVPPAPLSATDARVAKTADGWTCRIDSQVSASVSFDRAGKCIRATKALARPRLSPP